jgi:hypothetical protein
MRSRFYVAVVPACLLLGIGTSNAAQPQQKPKQTLN